MYFECLHHPGRITSQTFLSNQYLVYTFSMFGMKIKVNTTDTTIRNVIDRNLRIGI